MARGRGVQGRPRRARPHRGRAGRPGRRAQRLPRRTVAAALERGGHPRERRGQFPRQALRLPQRPRQLARLRHSRCWEQDHRGRGTRHRRQCGWPRSRRGGARGSADPSPRPANRHARHFRRRRGGQGSTDRQGRGVRDGRVCTRHALRRRPCLCRGGGFVRRGQPLGGGLRGGDRQRLLAGGGQRARYGRWCRGRGAEHAPHGFVQGHLEGRGEDRRGRREAVARQEAHRGHPQDRRDDGNWRGGAGRGEPGRWHRREVERRRADRLFVDAHRQGGCRGVPRRRDVPPRQLRRARAPQGDCVGGRGENDVRPGFAGRAGDAGGPFARHAQLPEGGGGDPRCEVEGQGREPQDAPRPRHPRRGCAERGRPQRAGRCAREGLRRLPEVPRREAGAVQDEHRNPGRGAKTPKGSN